MVMILITIDDCDDNNDDDGDGGDDDDGDDDGGDDANDDDGEWQNGVLSTHNQRKFCCKLPTGYWRELYNGPSSTFTFTL